MPEYKRKDSRKLNELRDMEAKAGVIPNADGSAMFRVGKTVAVAAVYGPREMVPKFLADKSKGILRCKYSMLPFSGVGERIRPGTSRRSQEISLVIEKALEPVIMLEDYPNSVVDVYIDILQADAGTRCAAINAVSIALAHAGIPMKDMVSAVAVGHINGTVLADLTYDEEASEGVVSDIPVAVLNNSKTFSLLQMDGEISKDDLNKALSLASEVSGQIYDLQMKTLKELYQ